MNTLVWLSMQADYGVMDTKAVCRYRPVLRGWDHEVHICIL